MKTYQFDLRVEDKIEERLLHLKKLRKKSLGEKFRLGRDSNPSVLCDAGAVPYQLSYQANWELVIL